MDKCLTDDDRNDPVLREAVKLEKQLSKCVDPSASFGAVGSTL